MESASVESVNRDSLISKLTGNLSIRSKLMFGFMVMIALTLAVSAITLISQTFAKRTITNLVEVHSRIARLSLETEKTLRLMQGLEKDFLLKYEKMGIQEAKAKYLVPFSEKGGLSYQTLYQIQELATSQKDKDAAQVAMDAINEYLSAFIGTVNIIELRGDQEFGELVKLRSSLDTLEATVTGIASPLIQDQFFRLKNNIQEYLRLPSAEAIEAVVNTVEGFPALISASVLTESQVESLTAAVSEFSQWFKEVTNTDQVINARVAAYESAAAKAEPVIADFLSNAVENEKQATQQLEKTTQIIFIVVISVGIAALIIGLIIAVRLSNGLTRQVNHIVELLNEIGMGNFSARTEVVSNDELGEMAMTLNAMLDNITVLIQSQAERDAIQESIMKLLEEISALTDGDLTSRAEVTEDMTGAIADSFNAMTEQFSDIIQKVKAATASVGDTSAEVSSLTMTLANKNIEQSQKVAKAISAINDMANSIKNVPANAQESANVSEISRNNAKEGAEAVDKTTAAMNEIREQINETARSIKRLGESSMEIGNVIQIIDEISDRTSILALNASIQAAMAGDAGHGFAVVADEVQRLAESSSNSTKQIEALIKNIQTEIKNVSTRMDESIGKVVLGSQLADGAREKLRQIEDVSNRLADLIESITAATNEQVLVSETITETMQEVGDVSRESSLSSQETATSMDMLIKTAQELRAAVDVFKVEEIA